VEIDWTAEVVDQVESHWRNRLRPRLDGLTDDEFFWEPVSGSWSLRRRGASSAPISLGSGEFTMDYAQPPHDREPVTTIAWRLAHLIDVFGAPTAPHFEVTTADPPGVDFAGSARAALRQLDEGYEAWIADVCSLGVAGLTQPQGALAPPQFADAPIARKVMYVHVEVIHHGAEICLLRDLYAWRSRNGAL
jgi:hypothetical protein